MKTSKTRVRLTVDQVIRIVNMHSERYSLEVISEKEDLSGAFCSNLIRAYDGHKKNYDLMSDYNRKIICKAKKMTPMSYKGLLTPTVTARAVTKHKSPAVAKQKGVSLLWGLINIKF